MSILKAHSLRRTHRPQRRRGTFSIMPDSVEIHVGGDHKAEVEECRDRRFARTGNSIRVRLREYQPYFGRLRNHRPGEHSAAFPYRQRRSDHRGLKGNIDLESGSGDLKLARLAGEMHFQTGSGNVRWTSLRVRQRSRRAAAISILKNRGGRVDIRPGPQHTVSGINGGFHAEAAAATSRKAVPKACGDPHRVGKCDCSARDRFRCRYFIEFRKRHAGHP